MGAALQFNLVGISSPPLAPTFFHHNIKQQISSLHFQGRRRRKLCAIDIDTTSSSSSATAPGETAAVTPQEPACIDFAFVSPKLLPDGTADVHYRAACGGQKLRDIMLGSYIDLYGPYDKPLLNCGGGGVCGTCIVEVVEGKEMVSPRTDKEKELLKRKPKTWRLACQTTVGDPDSTGQVSQKVPKPVESMVGLAMGIPQVIIQQLPEWKIHEWKK